MEKLIHILPYLITNDNTDWLQDSVKNPDELSQEVMRLFNNSLYSLTFLKRHEYNLSTLGEGINDNSSVEEILEAIEKNMPIAASVYDLIEELSNRVDCSGKSATSIVWAASILNKLEERNVDEDIIKHVFYALAYTLKGNEKNIGMLHSELLELVEADNELHDFADTLLSYAFLQNEKVQESKNWFNFHTLEQLEMTPNMIINSKETLLESLKDANNYNEAIEYIKTKYLSETDATKDGYCANENERTYKATIIAATLASDTYKGVHEFDNDNMIGLNLTANILHLQSELQASHVLNGVSNRLNALEDAAGRIASEILGHEIVRELEENKSVVFSKGKIKTGKKEDYIKNNLKAFDTLIAPAISKNRKIIRIVKSIREKYADKSYRGSEKIEAQLEEFAKELDVELIKDGSSNDRLQANLDLLQGEAYYREHRLTSVSGYFDTIKRKQKTNLDIENVSLKDLLNKDDSAAFTELHEKIIKEYYKAVASDPILKSNSIFVMKSAKVIVAGIKKQLDANPDAYPELARMFSTFKLSPKEQVKEIIENSYLDKNGVIDESIKALDEIIDDSKVAVEDKILAVEASTLSADKKKTITDYLMSKANAHVSEDEAEKE